MGSPEAQASLTNGRGRGRPNGALHPFRFSGQDLVAHVSGALLWPGAKALVVSDLHLEKGAAFARSGTFLPPYDSLETLDRLDALVWAIYALMIEPASGWQSPGIRLL